MPRPQKPPVALSIAGSDSGGGAGIQADLKTFAALGVHGATAITCLTAQNAEKIFRIEPCSPKMVRAQIEAVFAETPPAAVKTGMLYSAAIVREVVKFFRAHPGIPLVVDPVMIATSGRRLLQTDAAKLLQRELLPFATLVTPNLAEAEYLTGRRIRTRQDMRAAARKIREISGCAALVKGGHCAGATAMDILGTTSGEIELTAQRITGVKLHGAGCAYSAAIAAHLARGETLPHAITLAKKYITQYITAQKSLAEKSN